MTPFSLQPFGISQLGDVAIAGTIVRENSLLTLNYQLRGLTAIVIPPPTQTPARKDRLWETTCFEFFLRVKNANQYWEFNLSPAGHWNVYRFDGYRQGRQLEKALTSLPFKVERQPEALQLTLELDLAQLVQADQPLEMGISAVINLRGQNTYWAMVHPGPQADFHLPDSFTLQL